MSSPDRKRILIVLNDSSLRKIAFRNLADRGHQVFEAMDGASAFEIAEDIRPHLIISGIELPGLDGFQLLQKIRTSYTCQRIPFIILFHPLERKVCLQRKIPGDVSGFLETSLIGKEDFVGKIEEILRQPQIRKDMKSIRVLLAGVEESILKEMQRVLDTGGVQTESALSSADILTKVVNFVPDVVVLDVLMEDMTSPEIVKVLRNMTQVQEKPILLFSYYPPNDLAQESIRKRVLNIDVIKDHCLQAGASAYIGRYTESTFAASILEFLKIS